MLFVGQNAEPTDLRAVRHYYHGSIGEIGAWRRAAAPKTEIKDGWNRTLISFHN